MKIQYRVEIQPVFIGVDGSDVRNPLGIGRIGLEVTLQVILDAHRALSGGLLAPAPLLWDILR